MPGPFQAEGSASVKRKAPVRGTGAKLKSKTVLFRLNARRKSTALPPRVLSNWHLVRAHFNLASTARLPGQGANLSGKHVLSPSGDNGLPGLATIQAHILRQPV